MISEYILRVDGNEENPFQKPQRITANLPIEWGGFEIREFARQIVDRKNQLEMLISWCEKYLSEGGIFDCLQKYEFDKLKNELKELLKNQK